jgi:hypothetical protein
MNLWPWRVKTTTKPHECPEIAVVALPLTLQLAQLSQFLGATGESERTGIADKQVIDSIRDRIVCWECLSCARHSSSDLFERPWPLFSLYFRGNQTLDGALAWSCLSWNWRERSSVRIVRTSAVSAFGPTP